MDMFRGTITPNALGGTVTLNRIPVRDDGIHVDESVTFLRVLVDEFSVPAARDILAEVGYSVMDRTVNGVGFGKQFFFDFAAVPA